MALDHEIDAMAADVAARAQGQSKLARAARRARLILRHRTISSYRALFVDKDGRFTPDAVRVIADLGRVARLGMADVPAASDAALRDHAGRRAIALHILSRCDPSGAALSELSRKIRELEA